MSKKLSSFFPLLFGCVMLSGLQPMMASPEAGKAAPSPTQKPGNTPHLPSAHPVDLHDWYRLHPAPWATYFSEAKMSLEVLRTDMQFTFGPLGLRCLMHDRYWTEHFRPFFKKAVPPFMLDNKGELALNCYEVASIYPGSPAAGLLLPGDIIYEVNGERLLSGQDYWEEDYVYKGNRGLNAHMGDMIDKSEGHPQGLMTFKVLRTSGMSPAVKQQAKFTATPPQILESGSVANDKRLEIPVAGRKGTLILSLRNPTKKEIVAFNLKPESGFTCAGGRHVTLAASRRGKPVESIKDELHRQNSAESLTIQLEIPKNAESFVLALNNPRNYNQGDLELKLEFKPAAVIEIPASLRPHLQEVAIRLPVWGSFASSYPENCAKSAALARLNADFLVANQGPDGTWSRDKDFCGRHFDTSMAGLALLSMGDAKYDPAIHKAARFIAFHCTYDFWTLPKAQCLLFLSEYWLRYRDDRYLPAIQSLYHEVMNQMLGDNTAGHGGRVPAYENSGMNLGTSNVALAMAVASKTPISCDRAKISAIFDQLARMSPNGAVPYGRAALNEEGGRSRESKNSGARTGPALLGVRIYGGNQGFADKATAHLREYLGAADTAHAVSYMALVWNSLALARSDKELFAQHMQLFKWRLCMDRPWDNGGFVQNPLEVLDHQGGERVLGLWWRTAAMVLVLNATRRNMAITGDPRFMPQKFEPQKVSDSYGFWQRKTLFDRCCCVQQLLGSQCPSSLSVFSTRLAALPEGPSLGDEVQKLGDASMATVLADLLAAPQLAGDARGLAIETLTGITYSLALTAGDEVVEDSGKKKKKKKKSIHSGEELDASETSVNLACEPPSRNRKEMDFTGVNIGLQKPVLKLMGLKSEQLTLSKSTTLPAWAVASKITLQVEYLLNGKTLSYSRTVDTSRQGVISNPITVRGWIARQPAGSEACLTLPCGETINGFIPSPFYIQSGKDRYEVSKRAFWPVIAGRECQAEVQLAKAALPEILNLTLLDNADWRAKIQSIVCNSPRVTDKEGLKRNLIDNDPSTGIKISPASENDNGEIEFVYTLARAEKVDHVNFLWGEKEIGKSRAFRLEAWVEGHWQLVAEGGLETRELPESRSDRYRLTLLLGNKEKKKKDDEAIPLQELNLFSSGR
ncbi:MAG: hypothetical protein RL095_1076 [Verrucomicrobiota bacterium]|jgi:hypothetical protein